MNSIDALRAVIAGHPLSPATRNELEALLSHQEAARRLRMSRIIEVVSDVFKIPTEDILGTRRVAHITRPRHVAMYLARTMKGATLPEIARAFRRDHTCVVYAMGKVANSTDDTLLEGLAEATARLTATPIVHREVA